MAVSQSHAVEPVNYRDQPNQNFTVTFLIVATQCYFKITLREAIPEHKLQTFNKLVFKKINNLVASQSKVLRFTPEEAREFKFVSALFIEREKSIDLYHSFLAQKSKFYILLGSFLYSCISHNDLATTGFHTRSKVHKKNDVTCQLRQADEHVRQLALSVFKQTQISSATLYLNNDSKPIPELSFLSDCYKKLSDPKIIDNCKEVYYLLIMDKEAGYARHPVDIYVFFIAVSEYVKYQFETQVVTHKQRNVISELLKGFYDISCDKFPIFKLSLNLTLEQFGVGLIPGKHGLSFTKKSSFTTLIAHCNYFLNHALNIYGVFTRTGACRLKFLLEAIAGNSACVFELAAGRAMCSAALRAIGYRNIKPSDIRSITNPFKNERVQKINATELIRKNAYQNNQIIYLVCSPPAGLLTKIIDSKQSVIIYVTGLAHLSDFNSFLKSPNMLKAIAFFDYRHEMCWNQNSVLFFFNTSEERYKEVLASIPESIKYAKVEKNGTCDFTHFLEQEFGSPLTDESIRQKTTIALRKELKSILESVSDSDSDSGSDSAQVRGKTEPETEVVSAESRTGLNEENAHRERQGKDVPAKLLSQPNNEKQVSEGRENGIVTTHHLDFPLSGCYVL